MAINPQLIMLDEQHQKGAFQVSRSVFDSDIWQRPPEYTKIFIYLIGSANHAPNKYRGYRIERGQHFCTYAELSEQLSYYKGYVKISPDEAKAKRIMKYLRDEGMIITTKKPRGVLVSIVNYDKYQDLKNYERTKERSNEHPPKKPITNQDGLSINKNEKKENNEKIPNDLREKILKGLKQSGVSNPESYLIALERKATPRGIKKAWYSWNGGHGVKTRSEFFAWAIKFSENNEEK